LKANTEQIQVVEHDNINTRLANWQLQIYSGPRLEVIQTTKQKTRNTQLGNQKYIGLYIREC